MNDRFYFAYGSNMDREQMTRRCPTAQYLGVGSLYGYRFLINSRGVATILSAADNLVQGVMWRLLPEDEIRLDRYEGVPISYQKEIVQVQICNRITETLVYLATDTSDGAPRLGYIELIINAAEKHGFESAYIGELRQWISEQNL